MELGCGDEGAAKRQELSPSDAAATGEDRLSALPDDVLVLILLMLSTRAAAQTRVLSRRWRRIWALLPALCFPSPPEPHRLRDALDNHKVLLRGLTVGADGATPESLAVWLPAAARRVSGYMVLKTYAPVEDTGEEEEHKEQYAAQGGAFEFPCFEKATKIFLTLRYQGLAVPVTGVFARLTDLNLRYVRFHGPGELGDAVSSPRCPCLQRLAIEDAGGLRDLSIHSDAGGLLIKLGHLSTLSQLIIVAPGLKELSVAYCFVKNPPVADISAPLLTKLRWYDKYDPSSVHLGEMTHLQWLQTFFYYAFENASLLHNQSCLSLSRRFKGIKSLVLSLLYPAGLEHCDYMMENMTVLPDITWLRLMLFANGHAFEAGTFHVLKLCTGIRRFSLHLFPTRSQAQAVCTSGCKCAQQVEWETEKLLLNHLEEVEIDGCTGTEHEVAFVKRLFDWGTKLKEMTVIFHDSISEVNAKDLYKKVQNFSRPGVFMKFYQYENSLKVLYAPKD